MNIMSENDCRIYREELAPVLPKKIFDAHVHIFRKEYFPENFTFPEKYVYNKFGGEFPIELWRELMNALLPQQELWLNCFSAPHLEIDNDRLPEVQGEREFAMALVSPADSVETLQNRVESSGAIGVKPYLNYAAFVYGKKSNDVEVVDMLTPEQLEYLNEKSLAVTLHIPRAGRFADPLNQQQMIALCEKYPKIKFIFAHIGRAYFMQNIRESNIDEFAQYPNAFFDTAMINSSDILKYTYDHFPLERVLFGTDTPIALLKGKSVEINNQYAYLMGENYAIGTSIIDTSGVIEFTTFFYEQLRGIIAATPEKDLEKVLFSNAYKLFTGIKEL